MAPIISDYNPDEVDESTLAGTGRGGMLSSGYLRDDPIEAHLEPGERPVLIRSNEKKGISYRHLQTGDERRIVPGEGYRAFAVLTDTRLLFLVGDTRDRGDGDHAVAMSLADVEVVERSSGLLASELIVTTAGDVRWTFPCRGDLSAVADYLDAASLTWMDVERRLDEARDAVVAATEAHDDHEYDEAFEHVRAAMAATDATRRAERELAAGGVAAIDARIERMEDRIADVRIRTLESRATHEMDVAEEHWRAGEYGDAHDAFTAAHDDFAEALAASDEDFEGSRRLRERLARVERNLAALERAPVERADDCCERAAETDELAERGDLLQRALESYRAALELDWGRSAKRFETDTSEVRERVDAVARDLVEVRRRYASGQVRRGDEFADVGEPAQAVGCYREAIDALSATVDPARELVPEAAEAVTDHREAIEERLAALDVDREDESTDGALAVESPTPGDFADGGETDGQENADDGEADGPDGANDVSDTVNVASPAPGDSDDDQTPVLGESS
jgi:tetratricopeptide (TPR) repeat protein